MRLWLAKWLRRAAYQLDSTPPRVRPIPLPPGVAIVRGKPYPQRRQVYASEVRPLSVVATPERLSRETGMDVESWRQAQSIAGPHWQMWYRHIAAIAAAYSMSPAEAAQILSRVAATRDLDCLDGDRRLADDIIRDLRGR